MSRTCPGHVLGTGTCPQISGTERMAIANSIVGNVLDMSRTCPQDRDMSSNQKDGRDRTLPTKQMGPSLINVYIVQHASRGIKYYNVSISTLINICLFNVWLCLNLKDVIFTVFTTFFKHLSSILIRETQNSNGLPMDNRAVWFCFVLSWKLHHQLYHESHQK